MVRIWIEAAAASPIRLELSRKLRKGRRRPVGAAEICTPEGRHAGRGLHLRRISRRIARDASLDQHVLEQGGVTRLDTAALRPSRPEGATARDQGSLRSCRLFERPSGPERR